MSQAVFSAFSILFFLRLRCVGCLLRQLREEHRREHQRAAEVLPSAHALVEDDGPADHGEEGLQAQQQRDDRRVAVLLRENLQRVAARAREDADVEDVERTLAERAKSTVSKVKAQTVERTIITANCTQESAMPSTFCT